MNKFECKDLGLDCNFSATGATKEEVLKSAMEHGGTVHAAMMVGMTEAQSAEFGQKLQNAIKSA
jgi:predicted small metal-binding protein